MISEEVIQFLTTELLKIKVAILVCFVLLLIICAVYFVSVMKGEK